MMKRELERISKGEGYCSMRFFCQMYVEDACTKAQEEWCTPILASTKRECTHCGKSDICYQINEASQVCGSCLELLGFRITCLTGCSSEMMGRILYQANQKNA